jgi:hypothetical protein
MWEHRGHEHRALEQRNAAKLQDKSASDLAA